jgi:hypothetical protein
MREGLAWRNCIPKTQRGNTKLQFHFEIGGAIGGFMGFWVLKVYGSL